MYTLFLYVRINVLSLLLDDAVYWKREVVLKYWSAAKLDSRLLGCPVIARSIFLKLQSAVVCTVMS